MTNRSKHILFIIYFLTVGCTKSQEISIKNSGLNEALVYLTYDEAENLLWKINIPQNIEILNDKSHDLLLDFIQQNKNLQSNRVFEIKKGKLIDTKFQKIEIKQGSSKEFLVVASYRLPEPLLLHKDSLRSISKNANINYDSIPFSNLDYLIPTQTKKIRKITNEDTLIIHLLRGKSNPGFEKPIKIPLNW